MGPKLTVSLIQTDRFPTIPPKMRRKETELKMGIPPGTIQFVQIDPHILNYISKYYFLLL